MAVDTGLWRDPTTYFDLARPLRFCCVSGGAGTLLRHIFLGFPPLFSSLLVLTRPTLIPLIPVLSNSSFLRGVWLANGTSHPRLPADELGRGVHDENDALEVEAVHEFLQHPPKAPGHQGTENNERMKGDSSSSY